MTRGSGFTRVLALVLCLCLTVPYLPVPGHGEGCGHVHGEACYQEVTQCVHTHGEDCWSAPEARDAGEEPDACAHVCGENTGCVTKELNCAHTHDDTCGEQLQEEPEPEEPEPEEPKSEEPKPEEPKPQEPKSEEPKSEEPKSEDPKPQEPKNEEPKQEGEDTPLVISRWQWVDPEEVLDPETGVLCLSAEEPILFEQIVELLPKAILVGTQTVPLDHWAPKDYPQETGANAGSYLIEATLPEGYTLAEDAAPLTLHLEFAQAQALVDCGHENVNMDTGMCKNCSAQVYEARIGGTGYATLGEALEEAQKEENEGCTVMVLCDMNNGPAGYSISNGEFTLDLNEKWVAIEVILLDGGELTVRNGTIDSGNYAFLVEDGSLKIESGYYKGRIALAEQGGTIVLSGGKFYGSTKAIISGHGGAIIDLIAPGKALYRKVTVNNKEKDELVDASGRIVWGEVYVLDHIEDYKLTNDGTYKCACGRVCDHTKANMETGKCLCGQKQLYEAKIGDTGYATLEEALYEAQKHTDPNTDCTVTMLCDLVRLGPNWMFEIFRGIFTLDLNEKRLVCGICVVGAELTVRNGTIDSGNYAFLVEDGSLKIESGYYKGRVACAEQRGTIVLSGGKFYGSSKTITIGQGGAIIDLIAPGKALYRKVTVNNKEKDELVDASGTEVSGEVYVRDHTDDYKLSADGTYKCDCGRTCAHTDVDVTTGKCATCQKQVYVAKIGDTGYATLDGALDAAQEEANCTVTMLCDVDTGETGYTVSGGAFTLDLNEKKILTAGITLEKGDLTVRNGSIFGATYVLNVKNGLLKIESGYYKCSDDVLDKQGGTIVISGGKFYSSGGCVISIHQDEPVMSLLADGKAFYKEEEDGDDVLVDASGRNLSPGTYYVGDHPHSYNATTGKCDCGRTIPQATLDTAPAAVNLTYNGKSQNLVTPGTVTGGTLMYSLAENGTYRSTVPTGKKADTYTVWYYVLGTPGKYYNTQKQSLTVTVGKKDLTPVVTIQDRDFDGTKEVKRFTVALEGKEDGDDLTYTLGTLEFDAAIPGTRTASLTGTPELKGKDAGNYNLKAPTGLTGKINATSRYLDVTDSLPNADSVTVDGEEYPVTTENGIRYVNLPDTGSLLTVYSFVTGSDAHTSYPEGMKVYTIDRQNTGSTLTEIPEFENLLSYEGCSIRLNGTKGIRMITSIDQAKKKALVSSNLAGYTLVEYGTVITRESTLRGKTLNLKNVPSNNYNYAYSRANKKDPVFKTENGRIQYTNVLVNFQPADYKTELVLRPYIKLLDASGNEVTLYGGTVTRSIYYIAQQNINDYKPGSAGYQYLMEILGQK